jgi:hypothetical protein
MLRQGDIAEAKEAFEIGIQELQKVNSLRGLNYAIEGLASLYVNLNQFERAARLFAWADAWRKRISDHRPLVEQKSVERDFAVIHSKMDDSEFKKFSEEGRAMTVEQAIALALKPAG